MRWSRCDAHSRQPETQRRQHGESVAGHPGRGKLPQSAPTDHDFIDPEPQGGMAVRSLAPFSPRTSATPNAVEARYVPPAQEGDRWARTVGVFVLPVMR
jgi:hypothetical protein